MGEFRRNFAGTDIQHPFQDNFLSKLRRWCLSYLARSTLGLCIHATDFPILDLTILDLTILNLQFCWLPKAPNLRIYIWEIGNWVRKLKIENPKKKFFWRNNEIPKKNYLPLIANSW